MTGSNRPSTEALSRQAELVDQAIMSPPALLNSRLTDKQQDIIEGKRDNPSSIINSLKTLKDDIDAVYKEFSKEIDEYRRKHPTPEYNDLTGVDQNTNKIHRIFVLREATEVLSQQLNTLTENIKQQEAAQKAIETQAEKQKSMETMKEKKDHKYDFINARLEKLDQLVKEYNIANKGISGLFHKGEVKEKKDAIIAAVEHINNAAKGDPSVNKALNTALESHKDTMNILKKLGCNVEPWGAEQNKTPSPTKK